MKEACQLRLTLQMALLLQSAVQRKKERAVGKGSANAWALLRAIQDKAQLFANENFTAKKDVILVKVKYSSRQDMPLNTST